MARSGKKVRNNLEPGARTLEGARRASGRLRAPGSSRARFLRYYECQPEERVDLVICNGVFHHIPLQQRRDAVAFAFHSLRRGGVFAFWENNPWNPGTRLAMRRIPFDRDAIMISAPKQGTC